MELETDEASLSADSKRADEIDLYDDLMAFCNLSPEEQRKESAPRLPIRPEFKSQPANQFFYPDLAASNESALEPVIEQTDRSFELVEQTSTYSIKDSPFELPDELPKKKSDYLDLNYLLRVTGPLAAVAATTNAASPLLACKDCGSQASSADMFCVTCGGLLDQPEAPEAVAVVATKPACEACASPVEADEIFCPSCGAVLETI